MSECKWTIRPGTKNGTFFAFTPCKKGFNYLSKVNKSDDIEATYNGKRCPICGKTIICNMEIIKEELKSYEV